MEQSLNRPSRLYLPIHSQTPGSRGKRTALEGLYAIVRSELRGKHKSYHCQHGILPRLLLPLKIYEIYATADQQIPSLVAECCPCSSTVGLYTATRMPQLPFYCIREQGRSEGFDSCDRLSNLTPIGFKSSIFSLCDLEIWWMTYENNRVSLLYYVKLCASFHIHWWIQTGVTVRKRSIRVKISDFLSRVTLKFDEWHWKTIGHLFYTILIFVHHFKAIREFKLESQSGNLQLGSKSAIFLSHVTLKFDGWLWKN